MPTPTTCLAPDVYVQALDRIWCEPTTVLTDLLLVGLLVVLGLRSRGGGRAYFLIMAVAFVLGAVRHLVHHELHDLVPALSRAQNVASSVALGLLAPILQLGRGPGARRAWIGAYAVVAGLFVIGHLAIDSFLMTVAHQSIAQLVAVGWVVGARQAGRYRWFLGSIGLGLVCAVLFAAKLSPHPWFNHNDLAHVVMLPAYWLMGRQLAALRDGGGR